MSGAHPSPPEALAPALARQRVQRLARGTAAVETVDDVVVAEVPVALVFNGISHAVMMLTPQDLEDFALGFALSEGVIDTPADCRGIDVVALPACAPATAGAMGTAGAVEAWPAGTGACEVRLEIASHCFARLKAMRRALAGRTGCGVCGIDSLQALDLRPEPVAAPGWLAALSADVVLDACAALPGLQALNGRTGAVHAAGWALPDGSLAEVLEDVGRHNALDKLIGRLARTGRLHFGEGSVAGGSRGGPDAVLAGPAGGFVVMSSRASYELVRKCARLQIPVLATISAPTSLAVGIARQAGMQLWGFCRDPGARRYV
ncbi:MAG: formate dehydrogenase accessory sulfurtransferase FdhD [Comamonas sp.]